MKIVLTPNPVLTNPSESIEKIDKKVLEVIEEMKKTLLAAKNPKGVGLAAPQIGKSLRIFLAKPTEKSPISVFINPEIIEESKELTGEDPKKDNRLEGCLSIPGVWGNVKRHQNLKIRYQTPENKTYTKVFTGFMATIIQHEMDHLDGKLFSSRVLEQKGTFYKTAKDEDGKEILEELKI